MGIEFEVIFLEVSNRIQCMKVKINIKNTGLSNSQIHCMREEAGDRLKDLWKSTREKKTNTYTGWLDYPNRVTQKELARIEEIALEIRNKCDAFVVLGVGGSYMGAKALIDMAKGDDNTEVIFSGYDFSARYFREVIDSLKDRSFAICAISKSGSTMETMAAFAILRDVLVKRYGDTEATERTYIITESKDNPLRKYGKEIGATLLDMPIDIGGRYSVLTAVGLLPAAVHGIDIKELIEGAKSVASKEAFSGSGLDYAICRNIFWNQGKKIEVFEFFDPYAESFGNWLQQLFGETEGKDGKGIYPATLTFNRDLHSMGQFLQEGTSCFFETMLLFGKQEDDLEVPETDIMPLLSNVKIADISENVEKGVIEAHRKAGIPLITISIEKLAARQVGELIYFFMVQCAVSAKLLGVEPFNQPGVEAYKNEVRKLLKRK